MMSAATAISDPPAAAGPAVRVVVVSAPGVEVKAKVPCRRGRAFRAVLTGCALAIVSHFALAALAEQNPKVRDPAYGDKLTKLQNRLEIVGRGEKVPCVLALGSSRTLLGFRGDRVEQEVLTATGRRVVAFNFGTPASGPITHLIQFRRLLAAGVRPDLLILEVLLPALQDGPAGPVEAAFLTGDRLDRSEVETVVKYGFYPERTRGEWREKLGSPWSSLRFRLLARVAPSWVPAGLRCDWSRTTDAHGWSTPPRQTITTEERAEREAKIRLDFAAALADLEPDRRPLAALRELLAHCASERIPVWLLVMPEDATFRALYPPQVETRVIAAMERVGKETGTPFINARQWLPDDAFYDGHHMFTAGADTFTDRLVCEAIVPFFAGQGGAP